jgi:hypothetical protein
MKTKTIANILKDKFDFLRYEYSFVDVSTVVDEDYCIIKMKNNTTGISLQYERRENDVFVYLYKLIDGEIIDIKSPISPEIPLNCIEFRYIIQYIKGDIYLENYSNSSFDELIRCIADDLKIYCNDILKGNFNILKKVDAMAKKRRLEWQNN